MINCTLLDFDFLLGFNKLTEFTFINILNIRYCLPSLPPLPRLTTTIIQYFTGMSEFLNTFPTLKNGLKVFRLIGNSINNIRKTNEETVDLLMDWLLILSSANTWGEIAIAEVKQVTQVPPKISYFTALRNLWLYNNNISTIRSGAFSFSVPVSKSLY